jgi:hypothetical protein
MGGYVRFEMAGLDGTKVTKIDSFTVRRAVPNKSVADPRSSETKPGVIEFPDLRITLPASGAQTWVSWHDDFVVKGENGPENERSGAIVYLEANQTELLRINLSNCGIFRLTPQQEMKSTSPQSMPAMVQSIVAELYCERMDLVGK